MYLFHSMKKEKRNACLVQLTSQKHRHFPILLTPFLFIYFISTEFNCNADTSDRNLFKNQYQLGSCEGTDVKYQNQNNNLINMSSFKKKYLHRDRF